MDFMRFLNLPRPLLDLFDFFYPRLCLACEHVLLEKEQDICTNCVFSLPYTNHFDVRENEVEQVFQGRLPLVYGAALFNFHKTGKIQKLIHNIKYKGFKSGAETAGRMFGYSLLRRSLLLPDIIVPVPLHQKKRKKRGFNQSEVFAEGISRVTGCNVAANALKRKAHTHTQTRKSRYERWENVEDIFEVPDPASVKNKHILLVDDVITSGATIEACGQQLIDASCSGVSTGVIAFTSAG